MSRGALLESSNPEVRSWVYRIKKVLLFLIPPTDLESLNTTTGGRHDNDFEDFRQIAIYPTNDELRSQDESFLQHPTEVFSVPEGTRTNTYRDWLFRLLREDMLADLRGEIFGVLGQAKTKRSLSRYRKLSLPQEGVESVLAVRPLTLMVQCRVGISFPENMSTVEATEQYLQENKNFFKHNSFGVLCCDSSVIAFGTLLRGTALLVKEVPMFRIQFTDCRGLCKAIIALE
ncbi:hypothetical protein CDD82_4491 [Ophiocordyceps australis]|uniref:Uncharacterized protein n=1 Tax=Ophiocordyceps australis TaxID=1399860 RepID=A0A2C5YB51_9HYPO|nr:hypothetical protein CDD82_4491 [Ophiocordyceps australis]